MQKHHLVLLTLTLFSMVTAVNAQSLNGSRRSVERQYQEAVSYGYTFLRTPQQVNSFVANGSLVRVSPNRHFEIHDVSYPYARPEVRLFIERLSNQYHNACGEKLTVTSLTRPVNRQPANASSSSVHPTGMAVDLRIPSNSSCRSWLESTLLSLEKSAVLDVTRERNPPHYHVAIFTQRYEMYVDSMREGTMDYIVRRGDTLYEIASRTGSTVRQLRAHNSLSGNLIHPGQTLQIPVMVSTENSPADARTVAAIEKVDHQVRRGESLWEIAQRYGTTVSNLRNENGLASDLLQVGQVLKVSLQTATR